MPVSASPRPLTPPEEHMWRVLIRLMVQMPRAIDEDLSLRGGLSLTRYVVLMRLSEARDQTLRMSDLAEATAISPSRMTRVVQSMITEGLVSRRVSPEDARANLATLTETGLQRLRDVWPAHLAGVRALVLDHIQPEDLSDFSRVVEGLLRAIEHSSAPATRAARAHDVGGIEHGAA